MNVINFNKAGIVFGLLFAFTCPASANSVNLKITQIEGLQFGFDLSKARTASHAGGKVCEHGSYFSVKPGGWVKFKPKDGPFYIGPKTRLVFTEVDTTYTYNHKGRSYRFEASADLGQAQVLSNGRWRVWGNLEGSTTLRGPKKPVLAEALRIVSLENPRTGRKAESGVQVNGISVLKMGGLDHCGQPRLLNPQ